MLCCGAAPCRLLCELALPCCSMWMMASCLTLWTGKHGRDTFNKFTNFWTAKNSYIPACGSNLNLVGFECKDWREMVLSWGGKWSPGRHLSFQHHKSIQNSALYSNGKTLWIFKVAKNSSTTSHLSVIPPPFCIRFAIASTVCIILFCILSKCETKK